MRKYVIKIAAVALFATFLTSCEEDKVFYNGANFVSFENVAINTGDAIESIGTYTLPVNITKAYSTPVTVNFEITPTNAVAGTDYEVLTPTVVIPAGALTADFQLRVVDDNVSNGPRSIKVKIVSTSAADVQIGLAEEGSYSKTIAIVNDDCPTKFTFFLGTLGLTDDGQDIGTALGSSSPSGTCDVLIVTGNLPNAAPAGIVNNKFEVRFTPLNAAGTIGTVEVPATETGTAVSGGTTYTTKYVGTGTFNTVTGIITINYSWDAYTGSTRVGSFYTGRTVLRKAN